LYRPQEQDPAGIDVPLLGRARQRIRQTGRCRDKVSALLRPSYCIKFGRVVYLRPLGISPRRLGIYTPYLYAGTMAQCRDLSCQPILHSAKQDTYAFRPSQLCLQRRLTGGCSARRLGPVRPRQPIDGLLCRARRYVLTDSKMESARDKHGRLKRR